MKLGLFTAILPELGLKEVAEFAVAENLKCLEIACWPTGKAERKFAGITHINVDGFNKAQAEEVLALMRAQGIGISALGYYPNPLDPDPEVSKKSVAHLKKVIVAAAKLGVRNVNSFVGRDWTKSVDENWPRFLKVWKPIIQFAEAYEVKVGIENCPMLFTRDEWPGGKNLAKSPEIWRRMFNDIPSKHFGLNYDPSHFILQFMDPLSPLREFKDKLFHVHAKDMQIQRDRLNQVGVFDVPKNWHLPRVPGYGDIDWAKFCGALVEIGYTGAVCIEVEDDTFGKTLEGRKNAVKVARNVLAPFLGQARGD
jgi:sugar phosphate isomerase/epimerase